MNDMTRSTKLLLGAASIWPVIYIFFFFIFVFGLMLTSRAAPTGPGEFAPALGVGIIAVFVLHFLTIMLSLGLTVFYIIHAIKNEAIKSDMKAVWAVLFFFGGIVAEPVYWYLHIWKEPRTEAFPSELASGDPPAWNDWDDARREKTYSPPSEPPDWR
jgi:hypothetical protein